MAIEDEHRSDALWPDVPRVSFGPGNTPGLDACLSWVLGSREAGARAYVLSYLRAAEALFEHSTSCKRLSPDYVVFPLAFLWRQYVELALKEIISLGRRLNEEPADNGAVHPQLVDLWKAASPYIVDHCSPDTPEMVNVQASIEELERIDRYSTGFRYLLAHNQETLELKDPPPQVNLQVLQEAMLAISNFLDAVHTCQSIASDDIA